jgi:hypothetical protein
MKYNPNLAKFNSGKATMLILQVLAQNVDIEKGELLEHIKNYGVAGTAFDSSYKVCLELGLISASLQRIQKHGPGSLINSLTEKGKKTAELIGQIDDLFQQ